MNDLPDLIHKISMPIGVLGLLLAVTGLFCPRVAGGIERFFDHAQEGLLKDARKVLWWTRENGLKYLLYIALGAAGIYFFLMNAMTPNPESIAPDNTYENFKIARAEAYETLAPFKRFSVWLVLILGTLLASANGFLFGSHLFMKGGARLMDRLNKTTNEMALGAIGLILMAASLTGEVAQTTLGSIGGEIKIGLFAAVEFFVFLILFLIFKFK